jgi:tetratricopeptide (TPR) repeat protein
MPNRDDAKVKLADLCLAVYAADPRHPQNLQPLYEKAVNLSDQVYAHDPNGYDALRLKGHLAAFQKRFPDAEQFYSRANGVKPMQPEIIVGWTEVLLQDNQVPEAEALAFQLIAKDKSYAPIYELLFRYYTSVNRFADAEKVLQKRMANNPGDASAILQTALFYAGTKREADMKAVLQPMLNQPAVFPQAHLQIGDLYRAMRRWDEALAEYNAGAQAALKGNAKSKDRTEYLKRIADTWLAQGKGEQASHVVDEILKEDPKDEAAEAVKDSLLVATRDPGNVTKAVASLQTLVNQKPDDATLQFNLGRALVAKGDLEEARKHFQEAIKKRANFLEPRLALIDLSQARHDYVSTLRYTNEALSINPNLPAVRLVRAVSLINTGRDPEGEKEMASLEKEFPQNQEIHLQYAMLDLRHKDFKAAEDHFRKLTEGAPNDPRPLTGLVNALAAERQLDKAIELLQEQVKKSPGNLQFRSLLAYTANASGKFDLAIEQYQSILASAPNAAPIHMALGVSYRAKGDLTTALNYFQKAHTLAPKEAAYLLAIGDTLGIAGKKKEALDTYREAIKAQPNNATALNNTAYMLVETGGSLDEALTLAQRALRLDGKQPGFSDTLGWIYLKKNLGDSAAQVFRVLTQNYPDNPMYHYHFGLALQQKGDRATAKTELRTSLTKNPTGELRRDVEAALSKI